MFGNTNPFGQSPSSPFGSQPAFGQNTSATNNPFAPKPFGTTTSPFGAQTGSSIFGGTSTGVFGAQQSSSPFGATTAFGASSSSPAFGTSTPSFGGASSTPAFGTTAFGQKPAFGNFGTTTPSSPFGNTTQQSQPAFGNTMFGSSTPFSANSTPGFGATSTPAFGSTPNPTFGTTGTTFGGSSAPFGSTTTSVFGTASSTPAFGTSSTPAFGASAPAFGATNTPSFGATSSSPSFSFASAPASAFGQSAGSSQFGTTTSSPFGAQSSPFGAQSTTPTFANTGFGQQSFGGQQAVGSRVVPYSPTPEADATSGTQAGGKLESISAMPAYNTKSHEELRWEDYQAGDKGGPRPTSQQQPGAVSFNPASTTQTNPFGSSPSAFGQTAANNPFSTSTAANPFAAKTPTFASSGFAATSSAFPSSPFASSIPSNPFGPTSTATPSIFGPSSTPASGFMSSSSLFTSTTNTSPFASSPSLFSATASGTTTGFNTGLNLSSSQSSPLFNSSMTSLGPQTSSPFGQTSAFGQTPPFGQSTQSNMFSSPFSNSGANLFSSTASLLPSSNPVNFAQTTPSLSTPFQQAQPAQTSGAFGFNSFSQTPAGSFANNTPGMFGQNNLAQSTPVQSSQPVQQPISLSPFGSLPTVPQMSIGRGGSAPSIQYGISSMPVADKPAPVRISSLLTSRHVSNWRIRLPVRKYNPKTDGLKVPFFSDEEEVTSTPKADALFIPRENPRALIIRRSTEQWNSRPSAEKAAPVRDGSTQVHENGKIAENGSRTEDKENPVENGATEEDRAHLGKGNQKPNGANDNHSGQKDDSYMSLSGHRAGEAAIAYEHGADIEALMPKLRRSDYFTEPRIQELAAKERAEPGFCRHVKDFVVGRHGYGSIKFFGETDVRRLDLESLVQFNNREVIVYMDDNKKPPVGQGLNKPAEVSLLNIKCFDKKTGRQYTEGPKIEKYKEMLKKKAEDQGAEFVSYDAVKGEWKFKVDHFSKYKLDEEDQVWDPDC